MPPPVLAASFGQSRTATRVRPDTVHGSVQKFDFFLTQQRITPEKVNYIEKTFCSQFYIYLRVSKNVFKKNR